MGANIISEIELDYREYTPTDPTTTIVIIFAVIGFMTVAALILRYLFPSTQADKECQRQLQIDEYIRGLK